MHTPGIDNIGKFIVGVGAILENTKTGKILLLKRSPKKDFAPNIWEEVTGRMEQFEDPLTALKREVKEETGIENFEVVKPLVVRHFFRGTEELAENEMMIIVYWCKTDQTEIKLSWEHTEYKWLTPEEALESADFPAVKEEIEAYIKENLS